MYTMGLDANSGRSCSSSLGQVPIFVLDTFEWFWYHFIFSRSFWRESNISFTFFFSFIKMKLKKKCMSHSSGSHNSNSSWETLGNALPIPAHVILNFTVTILVTEKFSPYWVKQSHFGKRANDQINSFMELSDLIKLLSCISKLIKAIKPFCKWFFLMSLHLLSWKAFGVNQNRWQC